MKKLSVISSLVYVVLLAVYFLLGKDNSSFWSAYFFINNGLYISLLLLDNAFQSFNLKYISMVITAICFQVLLIILELYLFIWCAADYFKLVNNIFWSTIGFVVVGLYVIIYKIINKYG